MRDLSIDMQNNNISELELFYIELKQFYTSISQLQSYKSLIIVNTLANNVFQYQITLNKKTFSLIIPALYIFNLSTDL